MTRLARHFRGDGRTLAAIVVLSALNGLLPGLTVLALKGALDALLAGGQALQRSLMALVLVALLTPVLRIGRTALSRSLVWQRVHRTRLAVHARLHAVPTHAGDGLAVLTEETEALQYALAAFVTALRAPLAIVGLLASAVWMAPDLASRVALVVPVLLGIAWLGGRWTRSLSASWRVSRAELLTELTDQLNGVDTTLDHAALPRQLARLEGFSEQETRDRIRLDWGRTVPAALLQSTVLLTLVGLLGTGIADVQAGQTTAGSLVAFATALGLLRDPVVRVGEIFTLLGRAQAGLDRVDALLAQPDPPSTPDGERFELDAAGVPGRLQPLDLRIEPGQKVAVVGASGAGKSTLLALLAGRLEGEGSVHRPARLLARQDPWIFHRSLRENLELAGPVEELGAALEGVGLAHLEERLDVSVGERGGRLSGGERQRVALLRAIELGDRALLLDEATSEVEPRRAEQLARMLAGLDTTVVFATHEAWFPRLADRVLWLEQGALRGDASHPELLHDPDYASLWGQR